MTGSDANDDRHATPALRRVGAGATEAGGMLLARATQRIGYVVKCYPRFSETFIVNEIVAHEAAGVAIELFSLRPPTDGHFQDVIARVRAPVTYLPSEQPKGTSLWSAIGEVAASSPGAWRALKRAHGENVLNLYQALLLAREVRRRGIGHLHAHFGNAAASVARLAAGLAGIPYTFTAHAKDIFHETVDPDDLRRMLADAAAVVTVSDYNRAFLRRNYRGAAARVHRIYNGLDLARFRFRLPDERPRRVVAVGRLVEKKGFGSLIAACAVLAERGEAFECRIVGAGPLEAELRTEIERRQLGGMVQLLGPRPQEEVVRIIQEAAVFVAPCVAGADGNRDGLPTVLLEAMALGTPCVSTPVTGIPELVRDGTTGLIVPEHDPHALAAALVRLLDDPLLRVRLAKRGRRLIEAEFDIHRNADELRRTFGRGVRRRSG